MGRRLGRFGETAMWILVALRDGPRNVGPLFDDVRAVDGRVGPGTLYGALARLERLAPHRADDERTRSASVSSDRAGSGARCRCSRRGAVVNKLVRLYPRRWRDRYEEEFLALLSERPPTMGDRLDTVRGAIDAHLNPQGHSEPTQWTHRIPGLLALIAGAMWSVAFVAFRLLGREGLGSGGPGPCFHALDVPQLAR